VHNSRSESELKEVVLRWTGEPSAFALQGPTTRAWWVDMAHCHRMWDLNSKYDKAKGALIVRWERRSVEEAESRESASLKLLLAGLLLILVGIVAVMAVVL